MFGSDGNPADPTNLIGAFLIIFGYFSFYYWYLGGVWIGVPLSLWYVWKRDPHWHYWLAVAGSVVLMLWLCFPQIMFWLGDPDNEYRPSDGLENPAFVASVSFVMGVMAVAAFRHAWKGAICGLVLHLVSVALYYSSRINGGYHPTRLKDIQSEVIIALGAGVWSIVFGALIDVMVRHIKRERVVRTRNLSIVQAYYVGDYRLHVTFSDGHETNVDFGPFLSKSGHPDVQKYLDMKTFRQFTVRDGDLMWGDYDLIFPLADLYAGRIS